MENEFLSEWLIIRIKNKENERRKIAEIIRNTKINSNSLVEEGTIKKVEKREIDTTVGAVDSGTGVKIFSGVDIFLSKVVGVIYFLEKGKLKKVNYETNKPSIDFSIVSEQLSEIDLEIYLNILRQTKEVKMGIKLLKNYNLEFLLLNGSILPHYIEALSKNPFLEQAKKDLLKSYEELYLTAKQKNTILAGVIEDSRGKRFLEIVSPFLPKEKISILNESRDVTILDYVLKPNERTPVFYYSDEIPNLDYKQFQSFYIKVSSFDVPLRVDFLSFGENFADKISNLLLNLKTSEEYSLPSILMEADLRARLKDSEVESFCNYLIGKIGFLSSFKERRRERRPF